LKDEAGATVRFMSVTTPELKLLRTISESGLAGTDEIQTTSAKIVKDNFGERLVGSFRGTAGR
jgi:hypothetical protein